MWLCSSLERLEKIAKLRLISLFKRRVDAEAAIKKFDGYSIKGRHIHVFLAKYDRNEKSYFKRASKKKENTTFRKVIKTPAFTDGRRYVDVLKGLQKERSKEYDINIISVLFTLNVNENKKIVKMLDTTIIAEKAAVCDMASLMSKILLSNDPVTGMEIFSPNKLLLLFSSELEVANALDESCVLWNLFVDLCRWSGGEYFSEQCVWIEYFCIPPKCWSLENVKKIGEQWGPVICLDHEIESMRSLTHARMLVWTKAQNKIDARVRIFSDHGGFDVWVKETHQCSCYNPNPCINGEQDVKVGVGSWTHPRNQLNG